MQPLPDSHLFTYGKNKKKTLLHGHDNVKSRQWLNLKRLIKNIIQNWIRSVIQNVFRTGENERLIIDRFHLPDSLSSQSDDLALPHLPSLHQCSCNRWHHAASWVQVFLKTNSARVKQTTKQTFLSSCPLSGFNHRNAPYRAIIGFTVWVRLLLGEWQWFSWFTRRTLDSQVAAELQQWIQRR